jgi:hypothetical protein
MADTARRLVGPVQLAAAAATLYTAPAATTALMRYLRVVNTTTGDRTFTLSLGADAAGTRIFHAVTVPASGGAAEWTGLIVIGAGEILQGFASTAASLTIIVSGVEVT